MGVFIYGVVRFPDAPIHPCGVDQYCGKQNQPHTKERFEEFLTWEGALIVAAPFGFGAGFLLERRSRRRKSKAWQQDKGLQAGLSPAIEEQRYAAAWNDLRWRGVAACALSLLLFLWIGWAILQPVPASGYLTPLPLTLFALAAASTLWHLYFPCPRCGNRFFMSLTTISSFGKRCIHCDLKRGTTFEASLAELTAEMPRAGASSSRR